jgi:hypothetical protein
VIRSRLEIGRTSSVSMMRCLALPAIVGTFNNEMVGTMNRTTFAYKSTIEDRIARRRWAMAVSAFYGAITFILFALAIVHTTGVTESRSDQLAAGNARPSTEMARLNAAISAVQP